MAIYEHRHYGTPFKMTFVYDSESGEIDTSRLAAVTSNGERDARIVGVDMGYEDSPPSFNECLEKCGVQRKMCPDRLEHGNVHTRKRSLREFFGDVGITPPPERSEYRWVLTSGPD